MDTRARKQPVCNICTVRLVETAYRKAPWFRVVREPLRLGMRLMAILCRVNPDDYEVRTPSCCRCMRFNKIALKEKSALFRLLNKLFNPLFDAMIERILSPAELRDAEQFAQEAMQGLPDTESSEQNHSTPGMQQDVHPGPVEGLNGRHRCC